MCQLYGEMACVPIPRMMRNLNNSIQSDFVMQIPPRTGRDCCLLNLIGYVGGNRMEESENIKRKKLIILMLVKDFFIEILLNFFVNVNMLK